MMEMWKLINARAAKMIVGISILDTKSKVEAYLKPSKYPSLLSNDHRNVVTFSSGYYRRLLVV